MGADSGQRAAQERYRNGFFLAPMVRIGTLPMRLLSLQYGADLVWTSEVVDKCIIGCDRVVDSSTGVIAFVKDAKTLFTTHADERQRVIFQLGSATPAMALQAAKLVEADVSGVDLNCGCPKKFSIQGGMGAALMEDPDRLCAILEALVANLRVPVTCKIRVFDDEEQTLALVRRIAATGIAALTVHCRTRSMRPREKAMWGRLNGIVRDLAPLPVILNGDVFEYADVQRAKEATGATSVMTARAAAANPSIFRAEGALTVIEAVVAYMRAAVRVGNPFQNTKYTLMQMHPDTRSPGFRAIQGAKSLEAMCAALECTDLHPAASAAVNPAASAAVNPAASAAVSPAKRPASSPAPATPEAAACGEAAISPPTLEPQKRVKG